MKRKKHRLSSKWLILLLLLVIGSSTVLVANAFLRHSYFMGNRVTDNLPNSANGSTPGIDSTNTTTYNKWLLVPYTGPPYTRHGCCFSRSLPRTRMLQALPTNPVVNNGATLPPGSALPGDSTCASQITMTSFEPRPDNNAANHQVPTSAQIANLHPWNPLIGMDSNSDTLRRRITGNFTGTTDEILQWAACKWGIDVNIIRAEAVTESQLASESVRRLHHESEPLPARNVEWKQLLPKLWHSAD